MPTDCLFLRKFVLRALIAAALALPLVPQQAFAACSSPSGTEGEIVYNSSYHITQFCDGSSWISMAAAATYLTETDPKIGTLTALKWCATNAGGTAIDCTLDAPLRTANNLSDLGSATTARTNLGLGTIATQAASAVTITGGTINGTAIGGSTPAAGAFTTLSASGATTLSTTLGVSGATTLATLGVSGAATLSSTLAVTGDATFDTTTLKVDTTNHRVGIGTAAPAYPLEVSGKAKSTSLLFPTTAGYAQPSGTGAGWTAYGSDVSFMGGNVGIGSNTPAVALDVVGSGAFTGNITIGGTLGVTGNFAVNTNKFNVTAASGNTSVAGTLGVTGATTLSSTLGVTGDVAVNTNKFNVTASSGNTAVAGTLGVTGATTLSSTLTGTTGVGIGTASVAASALLDIVSTTKGMLPPRMTTTQRDAISSPATGLTIYNTTTNQMNLYNGTSWGAVGGAASGSDGYVQFTASSALSSDSNFIWDSTNHRLGIGSASPAKALDVVGTFAATGAATLGSTLGVTGDVAVNTNKFNVTASSGNTIVAGTLGVTGAVTGTSTVTGSALIPSGSTAATNGMYLPASNTVGISANSIDVARFNTVASGVNYLNLTPAATGGGPIIAATGSDTNVDLNLNTKGTGTVKVTSQAAGAVAVTIKAAASQTGDLLDFQNSSGTALTVVNASGNVGIGTATVASQKMLHVNNSAAASNTTILIDNSGVSGGYNAILELKNAARDWNVKASAAADGVDSSGAFAIQDATANAYRFTIDHNGNVGIGTYGPATTGLLDLTSTTKGFLPPRMTATQRDAISSPATGLTLYNSTTNAMNIYNGTSWGAVGGAGSISTDSDVTLTSLATNNILQYNGTAWVNVAPSTAMTTTTMVANWPDAIKCNLTTPAWGPTFLYPSIMPYSDGRYYYRLTYNGGSGYYIGFNSDGSYYTANALVSTDCTSSITAIYAAGRAFNFIGSGTALAFAAGTVSAPGLYVTADSDTGLYAPAANTLSMTAGGVEVVRGNTVASGVNYLNLTPAASGGGPIVAAAGSDSNIDLKLTPKGTGYVNVTANGIKFPDATIQPSAGMQILAYNARADTGVVTISGTIPGDNTIPQVSEGSELLTVSVTVPASASYLYFLVNGPSFAEITNNSNIFTIALFRDGQSGNNAQAAYAEEGVYGTNAGHCFTLWRIASPGAGTYTYRIRGGADGGSFYINAQYNAGYGAAVLAGNLNQMSVVVAAQ